MTPLVELVDREFAGRVAAVLAHSLWQAPLVALAMWGVLRGIPARAANLRYAVSLAALVAPLMAAAVTWTLSAPQPAGPAAVERVAEMHEAATPPADVAAPEADGHRAWTAVAENWQSAVVAGWLLGVLLMLVRLGRTLHASLALAGDAAAPPDELSALVAQLRRQLGITRRVAVVASRRIAVPGVVGAIWPTLVLPAAMIGELSPEELSAIVVHELVHIRRHDFAVNLVQLLIEALFFFNPAVWWIGRRVRLERESSVDAATVAVTGDNVQYASLLAGVAEKLLAAAPAPALVGLADRADSGSLLERVRRVVEPAAAPRVRLPWVSLAVLLLLAAGAVGAIWQGTSVAVLLAQELMSDQERIDAVQTARERLGPGAETGENGKGTVRGTIRTEDGGELPDEVWLYSISKARNSSILSAEGDFHEEFSATVQSGTVWLAASAEGYATVYVGPYRVAPEAVIDDVKIVLPVGFASSVRVTDQEEKPIAGAAVRAALTTAGCSVGRTPGEVVTDAEGIAPMAHVTRGVFRVTVKCPGYQPFEKELTFSPDRPLEIRLDPAEPFTGHVVSPGGRDVADAEVRMLFEGGSGGGVEHGSMAPVVARTDPEGRFELTQLRSDWRYALLIESPEFSLAVMRDVAAGGKQTLTLGPRLTLRGEVTGPLDELERNRKGPYVVVFQQAEYEMQRHRSTSIYEKVPVHVEDGVGRFEYSRLLPGPIVVRAGKHRVEASVSAEEPTASVHVDLKAPLPEPETRQVVLRFVHDGRPVSPEGTVRVFAFATDGISPVNPIQETLPVSGGQVALDVPLPGRLQCQPEGMIGWACPEISEAVPPGDGPLVIDVPVVPAGAIKGQVTFEGQPSESREVQVSVDARWEEKEGDSTRSFRHTIQAALDAERRYVATPVPLGAKCQVKLTQGHNIQVSAPFTLDAADAIQQVDLRLPRAVQAVVKVVDPQGRPVSDLPLTLDWGRNGASGNSWEGGLTTDRDGLVKISDVNAEVPQYSIKLNSRHTWRPVTVPLRVDGGTTMLRLARGLTLSVTVLDDTAGRPLPEVDVYAIRHPASVHPGDVNVFYAEGPTDESGTCRFSNLPDATVKLGLRGINRAVNLAGDEDLIVRPGKEARVTVRGTPL